MHTIASDGEMTAMEILQCAKELQLTEISITDHDAVGAYSNEVIGQAQKMGIRLTTGIEMDSQYMDVEIHVLGYGIDIHNTELRDYLAKIHGLRRKRTREQMLQINQYLKQELIKEEKIFIPGRETLMKPHLVHTLLKTGKFSGYREAASWVSEHTHDLTDVPKPSSLEICKLIKRCGGKAFIAHPGFYIMESGIDIDQMIRHLLPAGLDGLEVEYPYANTSPKFQTKESEADIIRLLHDAAKKHNLETSSGSDAHQLKQLKTWANSLS